MSSAEDFYDRLGLDAVVEGLYGSLFEARSAPVPLDQLKATYRSEFITSLETSFSSTDLRAVAAHLESHGQLPEDFKLWLDRELIDAFNRTSDRHLNRSADDVRLQNTIKRDGPD